MGIDIATIQADFTYTPTAMSPTHTDWYEWTRCFMDTYLTRLRSEIINDSTISAYNSSVVIAGNGDLTRYDINANLDKTMFILHSPEEIIDKETGGNGRNDIKLKCTVTAVARNQKGFDNTSEEEVPLMGDGTAAQPGVIEMQNHIQAMVFNNGSYNLLASGGTDYLWDIEIGEVVYEVDEAKKSGILLAHREITGHKWQYTWS